MKCVVWRHIFDFEISINNSGKTSVPHKKKRFFTYSTGTFLRDVKRRYFMLIHWVIDLFSDDFKFKFTRALTRPNLRRSTQQT